MTEQNPTISNYGTRIWKNEAGKYHRDGDLPAVETLDGSKSWWTNGVCYRSDVWIESVYDWIYKL